jgi:hypothetical protein
MIKKYVSSKLPTIPEDTIHAHCIQWLKMQHSNTGLYWHHSPNELSRGSSIGYSVKMKSLGTQAGYPDLDLVYKGKTINIEFKSAKGVLSENQIKTIDRLRAQGREVYIVRSLEEFMGVISDFVK